jgi:hypothetical protein
VTGNSHGIATVIVTESVFYLHASGYLTHHKIISKYEEKCLVVLYITADTDDEW